MLSVLESKEFTKWWIATEPSLLRAARSYRGSYDAARDIVQDVAILALRNYHRFTGVEEFQRWAHARLRWLMLDQLEADRRWAGRSGDAIVEPSMPSTQEQNLIVRDILRVIGQLPPRQQAVVRSMLAGRSNSDVAQELQVTEATVRSLQRFARRALVALLEGQEVKK